MNENRQVARNFGCAILISFIGYGSYFGYQWLDSIGWISHQEDTIITARNDWLVGESKECMSVPLDSNGASRFGKEVGNAMAFVSCDDGPEHKMSVRFYGRKLQGLKIITWRCTREGNSFLSNNTFTCYETGAHE